MPAESPKSRMWRTGISAVEPVVSLPTDLNSGQNFRGYDIGMFTIYPSGGAEPTIEIMVWDSLSETWISAAPQSVFVANAVDETFTFTVPAYGRGLYARVSVLAAGSVDIATSAHTQGSW